jgi:predicted ATPase
MISFSVWFHVSERCSANKYLALLHRVERSSPSTGRATGEPGIGKTRLADELGRTAAARGVDVHWGRAWEAGGAPPFWPFIQLLRSIARRLDAETLTGLLGDRLADLAQLLPELAPRLARAQGPADRFRLFDAVGTFIHAAAARVPQLLVLDDLHAADPSSLTLLHFLVRDLRALPLLVVGTFREVEARLLTEVGRALALVAREAAVLPLRRLDHDQVAAFVARATGVEPTPVQVTQIFDKTEGNPLFLRELLRLMPARAGLRLPDGIRETVRARLSLLGAELTTGLEPAAVLGREFSLDVLAAMLRRSEGDVLGLLGPAADAGIVEPLEGSSWRFTHILLREGLYEDLPRERRAALHEAAAHAMKRSRRAPPLAEIAHHLIHAVPAVSLGEAADATLEAAERATTLFAFEDAAALYERARRLLEPAAGEERRLFAALLGLGMARLRIDESQESRRICLEAAGLARRLGDGELLARAVIGAGCEHLPWIRDPALTALLEEALAALPPGDSALRARCMVMLAAERQPEPDAQQPIALARAAVAMARRLGDGDTLRFTLSSTGMVTMVFGEPVERESSWTIQPSSMANRSAGARALESAARRNATTRSRALSRACARRSRRRCKASATASPSC